MPNHTKHYQLHQWGPGDPFLRTDFNEDFAKIDGALGRLDQRGIDTAYQLYELLLQRDYEGKYTGFKRALFFDGFRNADLIQSREGFPLTPTGAVLGRTTQIDYPLGYGSAYAKDLFSLNLAFTGCGVVTGLKFQMQTTSAVKGDVDVNLYFTTGGFTWSSTKAFAAPSGGGLREYTFPIPETPVAKGSTFLFRVYATVDNVKFRSAASSTHLGGTVLVTPKAMPAGTLIGAPAALPAGRSAMAWVRHSGGSVGLALRSNGADHPMTAGEAAPSVELRNKTACTEQTFRLDGPLAAGDWQAVLTGALGEDEDAMTVYDYGVIVL